MGDQMEISDNPSRGRHRRVSFALLAAVWVLSCLCSPFQAAPADAGVVVKRPALRLIVLRDSAELLASEQRALSQVARVLAGRFTLDRTPASPAEESFLRGCTPGPCAAKALPPGFGASHTVLVLRVAPYAGEEKGKRRSGGFADVLLFRGSAPAPVFQILADNGASLPVQSDPLGVWLSDLVATLGKED
jgi:hypothetical protein